MSLGKRGARVQPDAGLQGEINTELPPRTAASPEPEATPGWLDHFVWKVLWKLVAVTIVTALLFLLARELWQLLWLLAVSSFFALAMIPGVEHLHRRWGWKRGPAVGAIYAATVAFLVLMVLVLIPALEELANQVRDDRGRWIVQLNDLSRTWLGGDLIGEEAGAKAAVVTQGSLRGWSESAFGLASSGLGVLFDLAVVATFAFYLAADYPRIERAVLSRMSPDRQHVYAWVSQVSIQQTGNYLYSRLLLALINAASGFGVMLILGLSPALALSLAVFTGFVSQFVPAIGTYIGAAISVLTVLAVEDPTRAAILLIWVVVYQSIENMALSPRLSAKTMELPGAVAFGATLAGGTVGGAMGAFIALPFAALITAVVRNIGKRYEVVYPSAHGDAAPQTDRLQPSSQ